MKSDEKNFKIWTPPVFAWLLSIILLYFGIDSYREHQHYSSSAVIVSKAVITKEDKVRIKNGRKQPRAVCVYILNVKDSFYIDAVDSTYQVHDTIEVRYNQNFPEDCVILKEVEEMYNALFFASAATCIFGLAFLFIAKAKYKNGFGK